MLFDVEFDSIRFVGGIFEQIESVVFGSRAEIEQIDRSFPVPSAYFKDRLRLSMVRLALHLRIQAVI